MPKFAASIADAFRFIHEPDIPRALQLCAAKGLIFQMMETSLFLNRETPIPSKLPGMAIWRESLFACKTLIKRQIDTLMYELYGLTEDEIRLVEGDGA